MAGSGDAEAEASLAAAGIKVPEHMRPSIIAAMRALKELAAKLRNGPPS